MRTRLTAAATVAALALAGLTGCGGSDQWCEHDATDRKVSNRYCQENMPGYEWESSDSSHRRKATKTKTRTGAPAKTTGPRTTSGSRTSRSGTSSGSRSSSSRSSSSRSSSSRSSGSRR